MRWSVPPVKQEGEPDADHNVNRQVDHRLDDRPEENDVAVRLRRLGEYLHILLGARQRSVSAVPKIYVREVDHHFLNERSENRRKKDQKRRNHGKRDEKLVRCRVHGQFPVSFLSCSLPSAFFSLH